MNKVNITKELLMHDNKQLTLTYFKSLDIYITDFYIIRAKYCNVEAGIEIKNLDESLIPQNLKLFEKYMKQQYEHSWKPTNIIIKEGISNCVTLSNETNCSLIQYKYFQNIVKVLNADILSAFPTKEKQYSPLQILLDDLIVAIIMPMSSEYIPTDEDISKPKLVIPKDIEENFIFDDYNFLFSLKSKTNLVSVKMDQWCGVLNSNGELLCKFNCDRLLNDTHGNYYIKINNKEACIDAKGNFIFEPIYNDLSRIINDNLYIASLNDKFGIVDKNNNLVVDFIYNYMVEIYSKNDYCSNNFIVSNGDKFGIINIQHNIVVPFVYDKLEKTPFDVNLFYALKNGKYGIIDINNNVIIPFKYKELLALEDNKENNLCAKKAENEFIIIDKSGKQVCDTIFEFIWPYPIHNSKKDEAQLYCAKLNNLYGFIDEYGNVKIDFKYLDADYYSFSINYCLVTTKTNKKCLIDTNDKVVISKISYEYCGGIDNDRILVENSDWRKGIIDSKNNKLTDLIFDNIEPYLLPCNKYLHIASCNDKYGFIDRNGKPLKIKKETLNIPETKINYKRFYD